MLETKNEWAQDKLLWHNGSNRMNYSIFMLAPRLDKAVIATTNFGDFEEAARAINDLTALVRE